MNSDEIAKNLRRCPVCKHLQSRFLKKTQSRVCNSCGMIIYKYMYDNIEL